MQNALCHDTLVSRIAKERNILALVVKLGQEVNLLIGHLDAHVDLLEGDLGIALHQLLALLAQVELIPVGEQGQDHLAVGAGAELELGGLGRLVRSRDRRKSSIGDHYLQCLVVIQDILVDLSTLECSTDTNLTVHGYF